MVETAGCVLSTCEVLVGFKRCPSGLSPSCGATALAV